MWQGHKINQIIKIDELFSLFEISIDKNYIFKGEMHNFWECVIVLDGSICVSADERVYTINKNEIIFHKPLELHKFHIDNPTGAHLLIFSFLMEGSGANFFKNLVVKLSNTQFKVVEHFLDFLRVSDYINLTEHPFVHYIDNFERNKTYSQIALSYIYQLLLSLFDGNYLTEAHTTHEGDAKIFTQAVGYMNNHIQHNISIPQLANVHNVSETSIKRIFKKYAGMGVHQYFKTLKINTAIQMLSDGKSVTDISEKLGFCSQGYFSLAFKRETGFTPSDYRRLKINNS